MTIVTGTSSMTGSSHPTLTFDQSKTLRTFLQQFNRNTFRFRWIEVQLYPSLKIKGGEPDDEMILIKKYNCSVTLGRNDGWGNELTLEFVDESGNIQQIEVHSLYVAGYEYDDDLIGADGYVRKKIKRSKNKTKNKTKKQKIKTKKLKSKTKKSNGCKKTSLCACKGVRCMVKPSCRGITKCSRGKKYSR